MKGLYGKYIVRKRSDNSIVTNCFVLRPDRDDAAIAAMLAYANATDDELLAQELREWAEYEQGVKPPVTNADRIDDAIEAIDTLRSELQAANARCETLSKMVTQYQDELIPGYRERAEKAERERDAAVEQLQASKNTQWPTCWSAYY